MSLRCLVAPFSQAAPLPAPSLKKTAVRRDSERLTSQEIGKAKPRDIACNVVSEGAGRRGALPGNERFKIFGMLIEGDQMADLGDEVWADGGLRA